MINSDRRRRIVAAAGLVGIVGALPVLPVVELSPEERDAAAAKLAAERAAQREAERIAAITADPVRPAWMNRRTGEPHGNARAKARRLRQLERASA